MNYEEIRESNVRLEMLEGGNLVAVGRASSLAWFVYEKDGEEYALHLQTGFRVAVDDAVFLASDDLCRPTHAMMGCEGFDYGGCVYLYN
ncbi:MAG: hypothetical protein LBG81_03790 [Coriobacteriaceae bacterium]|nr:hypothetical protein [Coriobacteriaceae bacterium]